jgi:hypothetical protein
LDSLKDAISISLSDSVCVLYLLFLWPGRIEILVIYAYFRRNVAANVLSFCNL